MVIQFCVKIYFHGSEFCCFSHFKNSVKNPWFFSALNNFIELTESFVHKAHYI